MRVESVGRKCLHFLHEALHLAPDPPALDRALRRAAREQGKSLNQVAVETLERTMGVTEEPRKRRDLSDLVDTWVDDPAVTAAFEDQRRIDPEAWR